MALNTGTLRYANASAYGWSQVAHGDADLLRAFVLYITGQNIDPSSSREGGRDLAFRGR